MRKVIAEVIALFLFCLSVRASVLDDITGEIKDLEPASEKIITIGNVTFSLPLSWETVFDDTVGEVTNAMYDNDGCYISLLYDGSSKEYPYDDFIFKSLFDSNVKRLEESDNGKHIVKETSKEILVLDYPGFVYCLVYQDDEKINTDLTTLFLTGDGLMEISYHTDSEGLPFSDDYSAMINGIMIDGQKAFPEE